MDQGRGAPCANTVYNLQEFTGHVPGNAYHKGRRAVKKPLVCPNCGKFFVPLVYSRKYCDKCHGTIKYYKKVPKEKRVCKKCGKEFLSTRKSQWFCTDICRESYHSKKVFFDKVCAFCGKTFRASTHKKNYCGNDCYRGAKAQRDMLRRAK